MFMWQEWQLADIPLKKVTFLTFRMLKQIVNSVQMCVHAQCKDMIYHFQTLCNSIIGSAAMPGLRPQVN